MTKRDSVVIVAPFDASSRSGGASIGAINLLKLIKPMVNEDLIFHSREKGELIPYIVEHEVGRVLSSSRVPIVIGGDHSITYHALLPICSKLGRINLVHFDAHHDNYPGSALNHYTVMSVIKRRLPIDIHGAGYRHDAQLPASLSKRVCGPTYISIDVDYFDKSLIASVGHAVEATTGDICDWNSFERSLDLIDGPIVGADIVEWYGSDDGSETSFLKRVFARLKEKVEC
jgi:arginase family enzyme